MKKFFTSVPVLLFSVLLLASCSKCDTPTITQLKPEDRTWLPYEQGNSVRFVNESGATVLYTCTSATTAYVPAEGYSFNDKCIDKQNTEASCIIQATKHQYLPMGMFILRSPDNFTVQVAVENYGSWEIDAQNPTYPTLQVNGTEYSNVFEVKPDSTKPNGLKRLLYNKETGFISAEYYNGQLLQLQ